MHVAVSIHEINEWLWEHPGVIDRSERIHIIDWGEETTNINHTFESEPQYRQALRKAVQSGRLVYHSNSPTPGVLQNNNWIQTWPEYDLVLAWQVPFARTQPPTKLYHSQNRLLKPHRTQLVEQLWAQDQFANGTVSYTQEQTADFKPNIPRARGKQPWQPHVLSWLEPYSGHDEDLIIFMENNPPPPLDYWWNAAVNLVTETEYIYPNLTVKTYMCFLWQQPLLVLGAPGVHSLIEQQGYQLHTDVFDYSFDNISKLKKRTRMMVQQVLQHQDVEQLHRALAPVAKHNQQTFINKLANLQLPSILTDDSIVWQPTAQRVKNNVFKARQQARDILV